MKPLARKTNLVIEENSPEFYIHDLVNKKFITLNPISAYVWRKCDGNHSTDEIAEEFKREHGLTISTGLVYSSIMRLASECLLETSPHFA